MTHKEDIKQLPSNWQGSGPRTQETLSQLLAPCPHLRDTNLFQFSFLGFAFTLSCQVNVIVMEAALNCDPFDGPERQSWWTHTGAPGVSPCLGSRGMKWKSLMESHQKVGTDIHDFPYKQ